MRVCGALALLFPVLVLFAPAPRPPLVHQELERERERELCDLSASTNYAIDHQKLKCILTDAGFIGSTPVADGLAFLLAKSREEWIAPAGGDVVIWFRDAQSEMEDDVVAKRFTNQNEHDYKVLEENGISNHIGIWFNRPGGTIMKEQLSMEYERNILNGAAQRALSAITKEEFHTLMDSARLLYVNGGNPWTLAKGLRLSPVQSWWQPVLTGHCIYIGRSAGTILAGANIDISGHFPKGTLLQGESHLPTVVNKAGDEVSGLDLLGHLPSLGMKSLVFRPHYESNYPNETKASDADNEKVTREWYEQYGEDESCVMPLRMGPGSGDAAVRFGGDAMLAYGGVAHLVRFDEKFPTIS